MSYVADMKRALAEAERSGVVNEDEARVLGYLFRGEGNWHAPGSFYASLINAAFAADPENLERIGAGFPGIVAAVESWRSSAPGNLGERARAIGLEG